MSKARKAIGQKPFATPLSETKQRKWDSNNLEDRRAWQIQVAMLTEYAISLVSACHHARFPPRSYMDEQDEGGYQVENGSRRISTALRALNEEASKLPDWG